MEFGEREYGMRMAGYCSGGRKGMGWGTGRSKLSGIVCEFGLVRLFSVVQEVGDG